MGRKPDAAGDVVDELARRILTSAKYRSLDEAVVRRVAGEAASRFRDRNQALKYAKRKLHQAFGAFAVGAAASAVAAVVEAGRSGADIQAAAEAAMRKHASSAERVNWLVPFYDQLAAWCGTPRSVVDLACGLNPLAIPWMRLSPEATYWCGEIDAELVAALAALDEVLPVQLTSGTCDLAGAPPRLRADVALLLKTVATLEQQRAGAAREVLQRLDCQHVIVSFARRSLSGRREYTDDARAMLAAAIADTTYELRDEAVFGDELVFQLTRRAGSAGEVGDVHEAGSERAAATAGDPEPAVPPAASEPGRLTLVGTPIGNLSDLPASALRVLRQAEVVCAEDTRRTRKLLSAYELHPPQLVSVRAHNEQSQAERVVRWVGEGRAVAYVTDAGMPTLSDPGQRLARRVIEAEGQLRVCAGPDAATAALLVAGFPAERWCFEGFLPVKGAQRGRRLATIAAELRTVVLFEAPHRLSRTLAELVAAAGGDRLVAVMNDLTKRFERVWRGRLAQVAAELAAPESARGEFVVVLAPLEGTAGDPAG